MESYFPRISPKPWNESYLQMLFPYITKGKSILLAQSRIPSIRPLLHFCLRLVIRRSNKRKQCLHINFILPSKSFIQKVNIYLCYKYRFEYMRKDVIRENLITKSTESYINFNRHFKLKVRWHRIFSGKSAS